MRSSLIHALLVSVVALAAGCSAPKLFYDRLDWVASWQISRYAILDAAQQRRFDADFAEVWGWHRGSELPRYADDLRELARAARQPLTSTQVGDWSRRIDAHWNDVIAKLTPEACSHLAAFRDSQVASTLKRIDRSIAADADEFVAPPAAWVRAEREKHLVRTLERWIGDLEPAQRTRIERWNAGRKLTYGAWLDHRRLWRARFAKALSVRRSVAFCPQLSALFSRPEAGSRGELQTRFDLDRVRWVAFLAELSTTLSERQRGHLRAELLELGADFDALAAERSS